MLFYVVTHEIALVSYCFHVGYIAIYYSTTQQSGLAGVVVVAEAASGKRSKTSKTQAQ